MEMTKSKAERLAIQIGKTPGWQVKELRRWPHRGGARWDVIAQNPEGEIVGITSPEQFRRMLASMTTINIYASLAHKYMPAEIDTSKYSREVLEEDLAERLEYAVKDEVEGWIEARRRKLPLRYRLHRCEGEWRED